MVYEKLSGKKVTRKCDGCGKQPLTLNVAHDMRIGAIKSKYNWLCPKCFDKWLESNGDTIE